MPMNSSQQNDRELDVFARFISIAGLAIDPASVRKCDPPAPDILCRHQTDGLLAFELTELTYQKLAEGLGRQGTTKDVLISAHEQLPATHKNAFDQQFGKARLYFKFRRGTTKNMVRSNISDIFSELSGLPDGFVGRLDSFNSNPVSKIVEYVSVRPSGFNGPFFDVDNRSGIGESFVPTIEKKLKKTYESDHPIELLGYLDRVAIFPSELWQERVNLFFTDLRELGPFRRIWIVDIRNGSVKIVYPTTYR